MRPVPLWRVQLWDGTRLVTREFPGHTKSEAGARAKESLGIPRKGRLPVGVTFNRKG